MAGLSHHRGTRQEEGDDAETPLAWLMSWGDRVQLLRSLDLEYKWERARQEECSDGEWGRHHGRRALSSGVCTCEEKKEEVGGDGRG